MYLVAININQVLEQTVRYSFSCSETSDQAGHVFVPLLSLSGPEGALNQVNQRCFFFPSLLASRFLGFRLIPPFLAGLEGPRLPASPVLLMSPSQTGKCNSTQGSVCKIMELEILSGEQGPKLLLDGDL